MSLGAAAARRASEGASGRRGACTGLRLSRAAGQDNQLGVSSARAAAAAQQRPAAPGVRGGRRRTLSGTTGTTADLRDLLPQPAIAVVVLLAQVPRVLARALHAGAHVLLVLRRGPASATARRRPAAVAVGVAAGPAVGARHLLHRGGVLLLVVQRGAAPPDLALGRESLGADVRLRHRGFGRGGRALRSAWRVPWAAGRGERRHLGAPSHLRSGSHSPCAAGPPPPATGCPGAWPPAPPGRCRRAGARAARRGTAASLWPRSRSSRRLQRPSCRCRCCRSCRCGPAGPGAAAPPGRRPGWAPRRKGRAGALEIRCKWHTPLCKVCSKPGEALMAAQHPARPQPQAVAWAPGLPIALLVPGRPPRPSGALSHAL